MTEEQPLKISEERQKKLVRLALSKENYREIVRRLGHEPSDLALAIFGGLWSEHCSYAHSKLLLRRYFGSLVAPPYVAVEANAGAVNLEAAARFFAEKGK